jgi:hypothetical protein
MGLLQKGYFVHEAVVVVVHLVDSALCNHLARFVSRTPATFAHGKTPLLGAATLSLEKVPG